MGLVFNIRGTNGAGKTTLARRFLPSNLDGGKDGWPVELNSYPSPTKKDPDRTKRVEGYMRHLDYNLDDVVVVGPYRTATGGLDNVPSFHIQQQAIAYAIDNLAADFVIAEGVLASTVYGSWGEFATMLKYGHNRNPFAFCYLQTPLDVCFERIKMRQEKSGKVKEIKRELVADKFKAIQSTRLKALAEGQLVYDLPFDGEYEAIIDIMRGVNVGRYIAKA